MCFQHGKEMLTGRWHYHSSPHKGLHVFAVLMILHCHRVLQISKWHHHLLDLASVQRNKQPFSLVELHVQQLLQVLPPTILLAQEDKDSE